MAKSASKSLRDGGDLTPLDRRPQLEGPRRLAARTARSSYDDQNLETNNGPDGEAGDGKGEPRVLLRTPFNESDAEPSPDGRWVAYLSNETGRAEVYVRFPSGSPEQWQISTAGGAQPRWRGNGKELFFTTSDGKVMATPIETQAAFRPDSPRLFPLPEPPNRLLPCSTTWRPTASGSC